MDPKLVQSALVAFALAGLPSALLGAFPLWLAWRRGRVLLGLASLVACIVIGWSVFLLVDAATRPTPGLFTLVVVGAAGGLLCAASWSIAIHRVTAR